MTNYSETINGVQYNVTVEHDSEKVRAMVRQNIIDGWRSGSFVAIAKGDVSTSWSASEPFDELNPSTWLGDVPEGYGWRVVDSSIGQRDFFSPLGINLSRFYEVIRDGITAGRSRDDAIALAESLAIHAGILAGTHTVADWDGGYDNNFHCYETGATLTMDDATYYELTGNDPEIMAVGMTAVYDEDGNAYIYTGSNPR